MRPVKGHPRLEVFCCCLFSWETHTPLGREEAEEPFVQSQSLHPFKSRVSCLLYFKMLPSLIVCASTPLPMRQVGKE